MFTAVTPGNPSLEELLSPLHGLTPPILKAISIEDICLDDEIAMDAIDREVPTWRLGDPDVTVVRLNGTYGVSFLSPHARTRVLLAWNMNLRAGWVVHAPDGSLCLVANQRELELIKAWLDHEELRLEDCGAYEG